MLIFIEGEVLAESALSRAEEWKREIFLPGSGWAGGLLGTQRWPLPCLGPRVKGSELGLPVGICFLVFLEKRFFEHKAFLTVSALM